MISREKIKEKIDKIHSHFDLKDFIGLSALIFGLLLSSTSIKKQSVKKSESEKTKVEQSTEKSNKTTGHLKKANNKVDLTKSKSQRKTASHRPKK